MKARDYPSMARLRPKQALKSIFCLLVFLLAGSFELSPAAEAFSCSGNSTTQQVCIQMGVPCLNPFCQSSWCTVMS